MEHMIRPKTLRSTNCDAPVEYTEPKYPYGLRLDLHTEELETLGLSAGDFTVDETVTIKAKCKVRAVSVNESRNEYNNDEKRTEQNVDLQITHMEVEEPEPIDLRTVFSQVK